MIHDDHCFHCGTLIPVGATECPDEACLTSANILPAWPWSQCRCGIRAYSILNLWQIINIGWMGVLGALLFLIGTLALSGRIQVIGIILTAGWFASRTLFSAYRQADYEAIEQERTRRTQHERFELGEIEDTPTNRKELNDEDDKTRSLEWKRQNKFYLRQFTNLLTGFLVLLTLFLYGPGNIFPWSITDWSVSKATEVAKSETVQTVKKDLKKNLSWDNAKVIYLQKKLFSEREFSKKMWVKLTSTLNFHDKLDATIERLDEVSLKGNILLGDLRSNILGLYSQASTVKTASSYKPVEKGYFQDLWEMTWFTLSWINALYLLLLIAALSCVIVTYIAQKAYDIGDEALDNVRMAFEHIYEKRGESRKVGAEADTATTETVQQVQSGAVSTHGIWSSIIGSTLAEFAVKKLTR